jgi:hypothetical protein
MHFVELVLSSDDSRLANCCGWRSRLLLPLRSTLALPDDPEVELGECLWVGDFLGLELRAHLDELALHGEVLGKDHEAGVAEGRLLGVRAVLLQEVEEAFEVTEDVLAGLGEGLGSKASVP